MKKVCLAALLMMFALVHAHVEHILVCARAHCVCVLVCMLTFVDHALCLLAYCAYCTVTHAPVPVYFVLPTIFVSFDPNDLVEFKDQNMGPNSMMMGRL